MDQAKAEKLLEMIVLKPRGMTFLEKVTSRRGSSLFKVKKDDALFSFKFSIKGDSSGPYDQYLLLQKEALTLRALSSYFDCLLVDSGESEGVAWNLMKWLDAPRALSVVKRLKTEVRDHALRKAIVDLFLSLSTKLSELHELGYVHRDIQPDHFLYDGKNAWLIDNTLCGRVDDPSFNYQGAFLHYAAPEVANRMLEEQKNIPYGVLSEIYSLGSTLFFLYTGTTSSQYGSTDYKNLKRETIVDSILKGPASFEQVDASPFPELESVLNKMMALNPGDRYRNLREAAESLRAL